MTNPLEEVKTRAVPGETLICTYLGKWHYDWQGKPKNTPLVKGQSYTVKDVEGLMITLKETEGMYFPNQFRRPEK